MKPWSISRTRLESFICLVAVALVFGVATITQLDIGTINAMGPGFFPLVLSVVLAGLGVVILFQPDADGDNAPKVDARPFIAVIASILIFAVLIRPLGLFPATAIAVTIAATGAKSFSWPKIILLGLGAAAFCTAVFVYGLSLPIPAFRSPF